MNSEVFCLFITLFLVFLCTRRDWDSNPTEAPGLESAHLVLLVSSEYPLTRERHGALSNDLPQTHLIRQEQFYPPSPKIRMQLAKKEEWLLNKTCPLHQHYPVQSLLAVLAPQGTLYSYRALYLRWYYPTPPWRVFQEGRMPKGTDRGASPRYIWTQLE